MRLIAHWVLGNRLYCMDDVIIVLKGSQGDEIAMCPTCYKKSGVLPPSSVAILQSESLQDYIERLFTKPRKRYT